MSGPSLPEKIVALHERLGAARISHAFGGALALAYYAEPRATDDVDVNVFLDPGAVAEVLEALVALGVTDDVDRAAVARDGQCRLWWGRTPLDLFFAYDEIHWAMSEGVRLVPFGEERLPILSPEHLLVCKIVFDRPKDWLDLEQVVVCVEDLDVEEIRGWLERIIGGQDPRMRRFDQVLATLGEG
jgi:hypothetical protein